jgi:AsmA protein
LYGGHQRADITLDATASLPRLAMEEHIAGVEFAPLFKDLFKTQRVSGKGNANAKLTASGRDTNAMLQALAGNIDFNVTDGALEGSDLWFEIRRARALLRREEIPAHTGPERTTFQSFKGTGTFDHGVLTNKDLDISMQYLKVAGQGTADLVKNTLDYSLTANVLRMPAEGADAAAAQDLVDARIPVRVTGTLVDPKVRPDLEGYLKNQAKQRLDTEKQKLEDKLRNKLKGILGGGN